MLHTAEIRWFVPGSLPGPVLDWFWQGKTAQPAGAREDRYLVLPGCETVGVKLRVGTGFDVKARVDCGVVREYPLGVVGLVERWVKWSCDDPRLLSGFADASADGAAWVGVWKERRLRGFSLDSGSPVEFTAYASTRVGCHVELTRVRVGDMDAWTLGLEAYGVPQRLREALDQTVAAFFTTLPPPPVLFVRSASASYPAWLARVTSSVSTSGS
jgi:hypothetical protein